MALTGKFLADFSDFYEACQKAESSVKSIGEGASKVGPQLNKLVEQFSGKKVIQEAALMTKAIEEIGGAGMLTESELKRVGATMEEALTKMRKAGEPIPANMQTLADATKNVGEKTGVMSTAMSVATGALGALGIQMSLDFVMGFVSDIMASADALTKLSAKTGLSTDALQKFQVAGDDAGNSVEDLTRAVNAMQNKIAGGDKSAAAALAELGIVFADFKRLGPEDQFIAISDALRKVEDPARQVALATDLMGKAGVEALPTLKRGFDDVKDAATGMSATSIKAIDDFGDQAGVAARWMKTQFGEAFADIVTLSTSESRRMADEWEKQFKRVVDIAREAAPKLATNAITKAPGLPADIDAIWKAQDRQRDALDKTVEANKKATKATEDYAAAQRKLIDTLSGGGTIDKAHEYLVAIEKTIPIQQMSETAQADINKVMSDAITAYRLLGDTAPQAMVDTYLATLKAVPVITDFGKALGMLPQHVKGVELLATQTVSAMGALVNGAKGIDQTKGVFSGMQGTLAKGATTAIAGALQGGGDVAKSVGASMGLDFASSMAQKAGDGIGKKLGSTLGGVVGSVIPVFGTMIGALAGGVIGKGLGKLFGKSEESKSVNPMRDQFVAAAGGIAELNKQAVAAGTSLDAMLKAKTVDDYNASLKGLQASFEFQEQSMQVALETAQRYGFTLEELGPALQRQELDKQAQQLFKDWEVLNAAGLDTVAITGHMAEGVNDYFQQAMLLGTEVPEAMRPMLEAMAKAGQLTDANGNKIEDLEESGVSFSLTMSEGFKKLIEGVEKLTDAISRGLGTAVDDTSKKIATMPKTVDVEVKYHDQGYTPTGANVELESYSEGTDGFRNFGKGTPVMLHGWEAVVPRDQESASGPALLAPTGGGGATTVINLTIDAAGAFFDTPGDLQRLADRVNDALTAKFGMTHRMRAA